LSGQVGFPKAVIGSGPVGSAEMWIGTSRIRVKKFGQMFTSACTDMSKIFNNIIEFK